MKKKLGAIIAVACSAALAFTLAGCGSSNDKEASSEAATDNLRFVTGGEAGTYYAYGTVLAQYATNNSKMTINALSGNGSKANVEALQSNEAELAFCQSDVLSYAYNGERLFDGAAYKDFSVVAALYPETVQIITCDPNIKTVADLKGKTVSIGAAGSGVNFNAEDVLAAYDMTIEDIDAKYLDFADSADSLKDGKVDAAFIVAGAPTPAVTDLSTSKTAYLVSMDEAHVKKLTESSPFYTSTTIPADTYKLSADVTTVSVMAVIIANDSVSEQAIYEFTASLFAGAKDNADAHDKYNELSIEAASALTTVPYHAGAAKYYAENDIEVATK